MPSVRMLCGRGLGALIARRYATRPAIVGKAGKHKSAWRVQRPASKR
jgi:hypothetical protein